MRQYSNLTILHYDSEKLQHYPPMSQRQTEKGPGDLGCLQASKSTEHPRPHVPTTTMCPPQQKDEGSPRRSPLSQWVRVNGQSTPSRPSKHEAKTGLQFPKHPRTARHLPDTCQRLFTSMLTFLLVCVYFTLLTCSHTSN